MAERDSTHCEFSSALMDARRELHEVMHHAGLLFALGEKDLPMDLIEESDALRIESRALMENLRRLFELITGPALSGGSSPGAQSAESKATEDGRTLGLPSDVVNVVRSALLIGMSAYGECDRVRDAFELHKVCGKVLPDNLYARHPTGLTGDVNEFAEALRFLDIYDTGRPA